MAGESATVVRLVLALILILLVTPAEPAAAQTPTALTEGVAVSRELFAEAGREGRQAAFVVLGRADVFADALGGSALAGDAGPLLLTPPDHLDALVGEEIGRVLDDGGLVYLLGGESAVAPAVERALRAAGHEVRRLGGSDRVATAVAVATEVAARQGGVTETLIARADVWADAVSGGAYAAATGAPVLLTASEALDPRVGAFLSEHAPARRWALGGSAALADRVVAEAGAARVWGPDRTATSIAVATQLWNRHTAGQGDAWVVAPGGAEDGWAYALVTTPWSAVHGAPQLLVGADLAPALRDYLAALRYEPGMEVRSWIARIVPGAVAEAIRELLTRWPPPAQPPAPDGRVRLEVGADLQQVVAAQPPGTSFVVAAGVHRLQHVRPRDGDRFVGEQGAVLSGARVLTGFRREGGLWAVGDQTQQGVAHGEVLDGFERARHPEDLFVDGVRLRHVGDRSAVGPGTWFFDYDADTIYLGDDPGGRLVETSVVDHAFSGEGVRDVVIENLTIRHYASPAQQGALHGPGTIDWIVRRVEASANHGNGISMGPGMQVLDCRVIGNGQLGIGAGIFDGGRSRPLLVEGTEIADNGGLGFNWEWEAGATKFAGTTGMLFEQNWVHHNHGPGPWFDIDNVDATIRSNLVEANEQAGILYEISYGARIHWNTVRDNGTASYGDLGAGVHVSNSRDVEVYGNALHGNRHEVMATHIERGAGGRGRYETRNLSVHDNDIRIDEGLAGLRVYTDEPALYRDGGNRFAANTWRTRGGIDFYWGESLTSEGWRAVGNDRDGVFLPHGGTPALPPGAVGYAPRSAGPPTR